MPFGKKKTEAGTFHCDYCEDGFAVENTYLVYNGKIKGYICEKCLFSKALNKIYRKEGGSHRDAML